jgi:histidine ammonia-lyase
MIFITGHSLTLEQLRSVCINHEPVELHPEVILKIDRVRSEIDLRALSDKPYYGINTGFGALAETKISKEDLNQLQHNLLVSHAVGIGEIMSESEARALLLLRLNTLAKGYSGCRSELLRRMVTLLNHQCTPPIPRKGSVGASGDLAPLAHLALFIIDEQPKADLERIQLEAKEGLALINGTQAMAAVGGIAILEALKLCELADQIGACSLDALLGSDGPMDLRIHEARPHPGQLESAKLINRMLEGSALRESHRGCKRVQDAYSLRCMPQVHGATRDALGYVKTVLEREFNSATDNPLVFEEPSFEIISGGNFHGQPVALALDFLAIATAELANISERRIELMLNPALSSGLPAFLTPDPGLNSGFMMLQVTAAALINENKVLCHPASIDSIPTSANREDHVSMGMTSANKASIVMQNVKTVLAIEAMCAMQALDLRQPLESSPHIKQLHHAFRQQVPYAERDRSFGEDLRASIHWLEISQTSDALKIKTDLL